MLVALLAVILTSGPLDAFSTVYQDELKRLALAADDLWSGAPGKWHRLQRVYSRFAAI